MPKTRPPRTSKLAWAVAALLATTATTFGAATPASAEHRQLLDIPVDGIVTGNHGDLIPIATVTVPDDVVGQTCTVEGETENQESVHPNNDLIIVIGEQSFEIPNFEDAGYIIHDAGDVSALTPTIDLFVRLGPDGVSSGGFRLEIDCELEHSTTTEPTTGLPTEPAETEPTVGSVPPPSGPTETATTSTTTEETTTAPVPSSAPPPAAPGGQTPSLPVTGSSTAVIALTGAFLFAAGIAIRDVAKSRSAVTIDD